MIFTTTIKIRGFHCDAYGHVNNARWVELLEQARWRWLEKHLDMRAWEAQGRGVVVARLDVSYRRPAHAHDELEFRCWITRMGGRSAICRQEVVRAGSDEVLLQADVTFALLDLERGRPGPIDGDVRAMFEQYRQREDQR